MTHRLTSILSCIAITAVLTFVSGCDIFGDDSKDGALKGRITDSSDGSGIMDSAVSLVGEDLSDQIETGEQGGRGETVSGLLPPR